MRRNILAIRRESSWFSVGDCFAMSASMSRSMPAQNALPAPVMIPTRAWLLSISSSTVCNSEIICAEIELRLSGRFSVIVAMCPVLSRRSVSYMNSISVRSRAAGCSESHACQPPTTRQERSVQVILVHQGCMRILCANLVRHLEHLDQPGDIDPGICSGLLQCGEHVLRCNVADEIVSRKGTAAKPGQRAVESPAARFIRSQSFRFGVFRPAV